MQIMTTQTTTESLNNKNDLKSTTNHNSGRTLTNTSNSMTFENCVSNEINGNSHDMGAGTPNQNDNPNWLKLQALKQRKSELEKLLNEKTILIEELQRQEEEVQNGNLLVGNSATSILKRKIGTNIETTKNQLNPMRSLNNSTEPPNFYHNIEKLLNEKKNLQEICSSLFELTNDLNTSNLIQKTHQSEFEVAQQKLIQINEQLNLLKRLESNQEQGIQNYQQQLVKSNSLRGAQNPLVWTPISANLGSSTLNSKLTKSLKQQNFNKQKSPVQRKCSSTNNMNLMQQLNLQNSRAPQLEKCVCRKKFCNDGELNTIQQHSCPQRNNRHQYHHHKHLSVDTQSLDNSSSLHSSKNLLQNDYLLKESLTIKRYQKMCDDIQHFNQEYNLKLPQQSKPPLFSNSPMECEVNLLQPHRINMEKLSPIQKFHHQKQISKARISPVQISPVHQKYENNCEQNIESPTLLLSDKYYFSPTQQKYSNGGFIKSSQNVRPHDSKQKVLVKPKSKPIDDMSLTLHVNGGNKERLGRSGLSEYWQISPTSSKAWDLDKNSESSLNSYDQQNSNHKLHQENSDYIQEKSLHVHNFDLLLIKHSDQLSITSTGTTNSNSNSNQSPEKDKSWVETAVDGPLLMKSRQLHHKSSNRDSNIEIISQTQTQQSLPTALYSMPHTSSESSHQFPIELRNQHIQSNLETDISGVKSIDKFKSLNSVNHAQFRETLLTYPSLANQPVLIAQEADSQFVPKVKQQGRQINLSHSTPYLNSVSELDDSNKKNPNFERLQLENSKLGASVCSKVENDFFNAAKLEEPVVNSQNNERKSEISDEKLQMAYTRSGTPKNLSVVHPAIFMPYKEYSKPFEMSDFYKYSTKFRQQQQQFSFRRKTNDWDPVDVKKTAN